MKLGSTSFTLLLLGYLDLCGAWFESASVDIVDPISGSVGYFTIVIVNRFVCWLEMGGTCTP